MRTDRLRRELGVELELTYFPLHPDTPDAGLDLAEMFGDPRRVEAAHDRLRKLMAAEGLAFNPSGRTFNSRLAQELGAWAQTQPDGDAIHDALYRAVFVHGRNIAEEQTLLEVVGSVGLDVEVARQVLRERSFRDRVDADWQRSRELGVTGVPTFVANGYGVVGAQPYEVLAQMVAEARGRGER